MTSSSVSSPGHSNTQISIETAVKPSRTSNAKSPQPESPLPLREEARIRLAMKMIEWIPLPCPKGVNGLFLSAAGMGSCGLDEKDEKAGTESRFWFGFGVVVVVVC